MYLIHNIYGDADQLINTKPNDVICIPFGWTPEIENNREELFKSLGLSGVSCLPVLLYYSKGYEKKFTIRDKEVFITDPPGWKEFRILDMPTPWDWNNILKCLETINVS
jgi:hypothetical protein